jgi:hypothetical protein
MECLNCKKEVANKANKFCDRKCYVEYGRKEKVFKNDCIVCETPTNNKKFCGHSCSATYNNSIRGKKTLPCLSCGTPLSGGTHRKYCNHECQHSHQYETFITEWKEGLRDGNIAVDQLSRNIRKYIFEKYDSKCCECGWSETNQHTGTIPLEVEHIDGNHRNNKESNLKLLCPNCHSLTESYRGANKGKGRKYRNTLKTKEYQDIKKMDR